MTTYVKVHEKLRMPSPEAHTSFMLDAARGPLTRAAPGSASPGDVLMFGISSKSAIFSLNMSEVLSRTTATAQPSAPDMLALDGELAAQRLGASPVLTAGTAPQFTNDRALRTVETRQGPVPSAEMAARAADNDPAATGKQSQHQAQPGFRHEDAPVPPMSAPTPFGG